MPIFCHKITVVTYGDHNIPVACHKVIIVSIIHHLMVQSRIPVATLGGTDTHDSLLLALGGNARETSVRFNDGQSLVSW